MSKDVGGHGFATACISSAALILQVFMIAAEASNAAGDEPPAFFLKIAKSIPRIGRSEPYGNVVPSNPNNGPPNDQWYNIESNPMNGIVKRKVEFTSESDTRNWQHFPLAIEGPPELWRTLAGYSNDPLYSSLNEFNNGLWSRDKRSSDENDKK